MGRTKEKLPKRGCPRSIKLFNPIWQAKGLNGNTIGIRDMGTKPLVTTNFFVEAKFVHPDSLQNQEYKFDLEQHENMTYEVLMFLFYFQW